MPIFLAGCLVTVLIITKTNSVLEAGCFIKMFQKMFNSCHEEVFIDSENRKNTQQKVSYIKTQN